jgi:hypothetical protein
MKGLLRSIVDFLSLFGIDLRKTAAALRGLPRFVRERRVLTKQRRSSAHCFAFGRIYPCLQDWSAESGVASGHYFHQDSLVARRICLNNPALHVDVGSRIDGFVAHVAAFRQIEVFDIRPLSSGIPNVRFVQANLMEDVPPELIDYCDSLSSLHAIEHFGLGRYGDPIVYDGYLIALENLTKILKRNGRLYVSVPIGPERIEFNAHRVFSLLYLLELFRGKYRIDRFSFVDDRGDLHENVGMTDDAVRTNCECKYGCGVFEMTKV